MYIFLLTVFRCTCPHLPISISDKDPSLKKDRSQLDSSLAFSGKKLSKQRDHKTHSWPQKWFKKTWITSRWQNRLLHLHCNANKPVLVLFVIFYLYSKRRWNEVMACCCITNHYNICNILYKPETWNELCECLIKSNTGKSFFSNITWMLCWELKSDMLILPD